MYIYIYIQSFFERGEEDSWGEVGWVVQTSRRRINSQEPATRVHTILTRILYVLRDLIFGVFLRYSEASQQGVGGGGGPL